MKKFTVEDLWPHEILCPVSLLYIDYPYESQIMADAPPKAGRCCLSAIFKGETIHWNVGALWFGLLSLIHEHVLTKFGSMRFFCQEKPNENGLKNDKFLKLMLSKGNLFRLGAFFKQITAFDYMCHLSCYYRKCIQFAEFSCINKCIIFVTMNISSFYQWPWCYFPVLDVYSLQIVLCYVWYILHNVR